MPNLLLQMLLRSSNAVGYTNYPDNVVRAFVKQAAISGVDVFRVFDSLNWVENMRVAIDAVLETGKLCEAAICYTGNLSVAERDQVHARLLPQDGPRAEGRRHAHPRHQGHGRALPAERGLHAGQGAQGRARDARAFPHARHLRHRGGECARGGRGRRAMRSMARSTRCAGFTSQPNLGSIVEALRYGAARYRHRSTPTCAPSPCTGSRCARTTSRSRATSAPARPRCTCTACPAGNTRTSRSRRARSASTIRAGPRCRRRMPT